MHAQRKNFSTNKTMIVASETAKTLQRTYTPYVNDISTKPFRRTQRNRSIGNSTVRLGSRLSGPEASYHESREVTGAGSSTALELVASRSGGRGGGGESAVPRRRTRCTKLETPTMRRAPGVGLKGLVVLPQSIS